MKLLLSRPWLAGSVLALCVTITTGCDAPDVPDDESLDIVDRMASPKPFPAPEPFDTFAVFIADGVIPPGVNPALVNDLTFFTDVMGWSQAEIDAWREDLVDEVEIRWGIPDPENNPDVEVQIGTTSPVIDYRAVVFSDERVPSTGWQVREGFLNVVVVNPGGLALGGEFAGITVPFGTIAGGGGIYNIEVTNKHGVPNGKEIVIDFRHGEPLLFLPNTAFAFFCELESEDYGTGLAQGIVLGVPQLDGSLKGDVRNVLTFSSQGGL